MFERFTERARLVVVLAQEAARDLGHREIGTEHVLLGLLAEREGLAEWTLRSLGVDLERVHAIVVRLVGSAEKPTVGQIPFTRQAKCVVELANVEVDRRHRSFVGTEHVLLGLVAQLDADPEGDVAFRVLSELKVTPEQIRAAVERFVPVGAGGLSWMVCRSPGVGFRGVQGAGWIDVLSLEPRVHLRRLLIRAAAVAMDADRTVIETHDLLAAFSELPEGAELLSSLGVTPARSERPAAGPNERDWTRIDAGERVIAAIASAEKRALENQQQTVTLDDLLLTLAVDQASLLSRSGWDVGPLRAALEQRRQRPDST
ncbi:MAG: Clp protease N-terminal domain-containing protein [Solirubrobacteraceae bacterium]